MKMGGVNLNAAGQLAGIIKAKEQEIDLSSRIEPVAKTILTHRFNKPPMLEMMPNRRKPVTLNTDGTGNSRMDFRAGAFANSGITMDAPLGVRNRAALGLAGNADLVAGGGINYGNA